MVGFTWTLCAMLPFLLNNVMSKKVASTLLVLSSSISKHARARPLNTPAPRRPGAERPFQRAAAWRLGTTSRRAALAAPLGALRATEKGGEK